MYVTLTALKSNFMDKNWVENVKDLQYDYDNF